MLSVLLLLMAAVGTQAKSWKIGPNSVVGMDFASINAAMESAKVLTGDTLFLDQFYKDGSEQNVTKQVVIIGTGYDTSFSDEQVVASLTGALNLKANNVVVKSVWLYDVYFYNDDCTLERCYVASNVQTKSATAGMNHIYSCYIVGTIQGYSGSQFSQLDIQNNAIVCYDPRTQIQHLTSSVIDHNTIVNYNTDYYYDWCYCLYNINNTSVTNNIILRVFDSYYNQDINYFFEDGYGNTLEHNILSRSDGSGFPTNKFGYGGSVSELFVSTGNYSNYYKLAEKSAAKGYATDGGDVGCHGGMFGCPSGGRPQYIPYFSKVTVGARTENGKLPVSVSVKIQDE